MCHRQFSRFSGHSSQHFWANRPPFGSFSRPFSQPQSAVPVNISEAKDAFNIQVFAPGLDKIAFEITVTDDVLSVRFNGPAKSTTDRWVYQEHPIEPFERQFLLNGKVDTSLIVAQYRDGVLDIHLPKKPDAVGQEIPIA
jgi:HSP20 family protein